MSAAPLPDRDERTLAVENASYRWAYLFLSFGLLVIVAYRSFVFRESPLDLLLLVVLGGVVATVYQGLPNVLNRHWGIMTVLVIAVAAVVAVLVAWPWRG